MSFESKLLMEQTQIKIKPVNKRKTETAGSQHKREGRRSWGWQRAPLAEDSRVELFAESGFC